MLSSEDWFCCSCCLGVVWYWWMWNPSGLGLWHSLVGGFKWYILVCISESCIRKIFASRMLTKQHSSSYTQKSLKENENWNLGSENCEKRGEMLLCIWVPMLGHSLSKADCHLVDVFVLAQKTIYYVEKCYTYSQVLTSKDSLAIGCCMYFHMLFHPMIIFLRVSTWEWH